MIHLMFKKLKNYWPLIALILVCFLGASALIIGFSFPAPQFFMHAYMGLFLLVFALLKLFDLKSFQKGFVRYDLLAMRVPFYGFLYPFIELGLALAYLSFFYPFYTYCVTLFVFSFGAMGVFFGLRRGLDMKCPCMGTVLSVPLSTVTLSEDLLMVVMALMLFIML